MPVSKYNSIHDFVLIELRMFVQTKLEDWHRATDQELKLIKEAWGVIGI